MSPYPPSRVRHPVGMLILQLCNRSSCRTIPRYRRVPMHRSEALFNSGLFAPSQLTELSVKDSLYLLVSSSHFEYLTLSYQIIQLKETIFLLGLDLIEKFRLHFPGRFIEERFRILVLLRKDPLDRVRDDGVFVLPALLRFGQAVEQQPTIRFRPLIARSSVKNKDRYAGPCSNWIVIRSVPTFEATFARSKPLRHA